MTRQRNERRNDYDYQRNDGKLVRMFLAEGNKNELKAKRVNYMKEKRRFQQIVTFSPLVWCLQLQLQLQLQLELHLQLMLPAGLILGAFPFHLFLNYLVGFLPDVKSPNLRASSLTEMNTLRIDQNTKPRTSWLPLHLHHANVSFSIHRTK